MSGNATPGTYDSTKELEFEMQIGNKKSPEYPIRSVAEAYYQLRKTLGAHGINAQIDMAATYYINDKFALAIGTEKVLGLVPAVSTVRRGT